MDKDAALSYIANVDWRESRLGLARMFHLLEAMGNPHEKLRFVHVAGTNGKGSVCAMAASVLSAAGYRTGLYTSPFITRFNERIQVDDAPIPDGELAVITDAIRPHADAMDDHPTEFELVTVLAFEYFLRQKCDVVVLEVGLGGRLDATNVLPPANLLAAVVTAIDYDHTAELGDTLEAIAAEKGGIIKPGCPAVLAPQQPGPLAVLQRICAEQGAEATEVDTARIQPVSDGVAGQTFDWGPHKNLSIPLLGGHQLLNAATVLTLAEVLACRGLSLPDEAIRSGLAAVRWPARFEVMRAEPPFIVDGGHNAQCVRVLAQNLRQYFPGRAFVFLVGVMADKDFEAMFAPVLPLAEAVVCVAPDNPRALPADDLAALFRAQGVADVTACHSVQVGIETALQRAGVDGAVCAFGSFYMAGTIRARFGLA